MTGTVNFNYHTQSFNIEINDIVSYHPLTIKIYVMELSFVQLLPEYNLRFVACFSQASGSAVKTFFSGKKVREVTINRSGIDIA